jgi:predicted metal-binding protein
VISALSNGCGRFVVAGAESSISLPQCKLAAPPHCKYTNMDTFTFTCTGFQSDMEEMKENVYGLFD